MSVNLLILSWPEAFHFTILLTVYIFFNLNVLYYIPWTSFLESANRSSFLLLFPSFPLSFLKSFHFSRIRLVSLPLCFLVYCRICFHYSGLFLFCLCCWFLLSQMRVLFAMLELSLIHHGGVFPFYVLIFHKYAS